MQQPCSRCGYISDRPARFCRQCGSQLTEETDASSATTQNYASMAAQSAVPQPAIPAYAPQQQWNEQTPETTPFYRPPIASQTPISMTSQKRTSWGKWILISLLTFMLICIVAIGGALYVGKKWVENHNISVAEEGGSAPAMPPLPPDAPEPPDAPPAPAIAGNLDKYKYPDAEVTQSHKDGMTEMIQMTTTDDLEDVREYYRKKLKNVMSINDEKGKKLIFTSLGQPMITVIVQPDESDTDKTQIVLSRVNIAIPQITIPKIEIH